MPLEQSCLSVASAEEVGIHFGNGYLFQDHDYHIGFDIYGDLYDDFPYLKYYVVPLLRRLYGVEPRVYVHPLSSTLIVRVNSSAAFKTKHELGCPIGRKRSLRIPSAICDGPSGLLRGFARGLFDIEGTLRFQRRGEYHCYPSLECELADPEFVMSVFIQLRQHRFPFCFRMRGFESARVNQRTKASTYTSGWHNLETWMRLVGLKNPKHLSKILIARINGFCPPWTSLDERLCIVAGELDPASFHKMNRQERQIESRTVAHELLVLRVCSIRRNFDQFIAAMKSRAELSELVIRRLEKKKEISKSTENRMRTIQASELGLERLERIFEAWTPLRQCFGIPTPASANYHPFALV